MEYKEGKEAVMKRGGEKLAEALVSCWINKFSVGQCVMFQVIQPVSEQVRAWIIPEDYNHAEAEAKHLIYEADSDGDRELTKEEILDKYDVFVGSQATDFGEALVRHDEF